MSAVVYRAHPDGRLTAGLDLRRDLTRAIRRHRPDLVVTLHHGETWGPGMLNSSDHRLLGLATLDAAADAGNEWIFPDLADLDPWTARWVAVMAPNGSHAVDVTDTVEQAVASLCEHRRYLEALSDEPVEVQARKQIEMVTGPIEGFEAERAVCFELYTFMG